MKNILCDGDTMIGICMIIGGGVIGCGLLSDCGINLGMHLLGGKGVVNWRLRFVRCSV